MVRDSNVARCVAVLCKGRPAAEFLNEARSTAREVLRIDPNYRIGGRQTRVRIRKRPEDSEHLAEGLRKAGLPEK